MSKKNNTIFLKRVIRYIVCVCVCDITTILASARLALGGLTRRDNGTAVIAFSSP